jgi:hypothetical protein
MRSVRIKNLPNYYGLHKHGYMPQYANVKVGLVQDIHWHSYKTGENERIFPTWYEAFAYLASSFGHNYVALYMCFVGLLTTERLAERTRLEAQEKQKLCVKSQS